MTQIMARCLGLLLCMLLVSGGAAASQVRATIISDDLYVSGNGTSAVEDVATICVRSSFAGHAYRIIIDGAHSSAGNLQLRHTSHASYHEYSLHWRMNPTADWVSVVSSQSISAQSGISFTTSCAINNSAQLRVSLSQAQFSALPTGSYQDTISLTVSEDS